MKTVLNLIKKGDWALSVDLKDAYFQILIHPSHRKYLRFCIKGKVYQYRALAFGPKTSPRVFTKVVAVAAAHLRMQSIRLAVHLDDWLALNAIKQMLLRDRENSKSPFSTRFSDKCRKIKSGTDTTHYIHRGNCHANSRQNGKIKRICNGTKGKYCVSKAISACSRYNGLMYRDNSKCKTLQEMIYINF